MHMLILHGENQFDSRKQLGNAISDYTSRGYRIIRLEAIKVNRSVLEEAFGTHSLFAQPELIIIEGLHGLPVSAKKKELIELLITQLKNDDSAADDDTAGDSENQKECILWESRTLTKTMLKPFVSLGATIREYPISQMLFRWLDSLSTNSQSKPQQLKLLATTLEQENEFIVFTMLCRQIRLLLEVKTGGMPKVAPFILTKLQKQARVFTEDQLLSVHQRLSRIDLQMKSSQGYLGLPAQLDLLILSL